MPTDINIEVAGENALIIYFEQRQDKLEIAAIIVLTQQLIRDKLSKEVIDLIPSYSSILIVFDRFVINYHQLKEKLKAIVAKVINTQSHSTESTSELNKKIIELPVYYSLESGPDLAKIAAQANLTIEQVIELHQSQRYQVFTIGFAPGFAYLGNVDARIATSRLTTPRHQVPKGSVGIANNQTAVYPSNSPAGWNIIGLCPTEMFTVNASPAMPITIGDTVQFNGISKAEFLALGGVIGSFS